MGLILEKSMTRITIATTCSESRNNCEFQVIKNATDSWRAYFEQAQTIFPKGYTRLGPALRHATSILNKSAAQKKVLLLLTDGKPTDIDGYEGKYGIEDMRKLPYQRKVTVYILKPSRSKKNQGITFHICLDAMKY